MKLRAFIDAPVRGVRRLTSMIFKRNPIRISLVSRSSYDYLKDVGDGTGSSTVMAPLLWIARTFPEAPPMLWRQFPDGHEEPERAHPMLRLLQRPNEHFSGSILWMATLMDWYVDGNAYWLKVRTNGGMVGELWWAPSWLIEPKGSAEEVVTHYEYRPGFETVRLPVDDVVHFRFGMDGDDPRNGRSPLKSVLREVFTDDEAATFTASLLKNMGVPGLIVSPDSDQPASDEDVKATKAYIAASSTGDKRGGTLVMKGRTKVEQFGFSPEQLLLKELRRIPEERVSAVLGVPAIVAGLGAGLDRSTFTNYTEARQAAYEQTLIPTQRILSEDIRFQLLTDWEGDPWGWRCGFDLSNVRILQDDQDKLATRLNVGVAGGWIKRAEARRAMGQTVAKDGSDDCYLIPLNMAVVPADGSPHRTFTPPVGAANGDRFKLALDRALAAQRYGLAAKAGIVHEEEARDDLGFSGPPPERDASASPDDAAALNGDGDQLVAVAAIGSLEEGLEHEHD